MFAKLLVLILSLAAISASALAFRHARLEAARELARARLEVHELDERLARARSRIAEHVNPERVERLAERLGPIKPIVRERRDPDGGDEPGARPPVRRTGEDDATPSDPT